MITLLPKLIMLFVFLLSYQSYAVVHSPLFNDIGSTLNATVIKKAPIVLKSMMDIKNLCNKKSCSLMHVDDAIVRMSLDLSMEKIIKHLADREKISDVPLVQHGLVLGTSVNKLLSLRNHLQSAHPDSSNLIDQHFLATKHAYDLYQAGLITPIPQNTKEAAALIGVLGLNIQMLQSPNADPFQYSPLHQAAQIQLLLHPEILMTKDQGMNRIQKAALFAVLAGYGLLETWYEKKNDRALYGTAYTRMSQRIMNLTTLLQILSMK